MFMDYAELLSNNENITVINTDFTYFFFTLIALRLKKGIVSQLGKTGPLLIPSNALNFISSSGNLKSHYCVF